MVSLGLLRLHRSPELAASILLLKIGLVQAQLASLNCQPACVFKF